MSVIDDQSKKKYYYKAISMMGYYQRIDSGVRKIFCFPSFLKEGKICLLEINDKILPELTTPDIPFEYNIKDLELPEEPQYTVSIVTITENQYNELLIGKIKLPPSWNLEERKDRHQMADIPALISQGYIDE